MLVLGQGMVGRRELLSVVSEATTLGFLNRFSRCVCRELRRDCEAVGHKIKLFETSNDLV
jgi:hypothetical protein